MLAPWREGRKRRKGRRARQGCARARALERSAARRAGRGVCSRGGKGAVKRARSRSPFMRIGGRRHRRRRGLRAAARPNSLALFGKKRRDGRGCVE